MDVNWNLLKISYELFGESVSSLASEAGVSPAIVQYAIDEQGWERKQIAHAPTPSLDPNDLENASADLVEHVKSTLDLRNTLKQQTLAPAYMKLEMALLDKATQIANTLNSSAGNAASQLKALTEAWRNLLEQNRLVSGSSGTGASGDGDSGKVVVQIMNKVDCNP